MNYFEAELLKDLDGEIRAGSVVVGPDSATYFSRLAECYPVCGSKIQWSKVPGSIELNENSDSNESTEFSDFFAKMVARHGLSEKIIYIGDGAINFFLLSFAEKFVKYLNALLSIPQHHYFIAEDYSWCMVFTFEGDMSFGLMPK